MLPLFFLFLLLVLGALAWYGRQQNVLKVAPGGREAWVLEDLVGRQKVIHGGVHTEWPWWKLDEKVTLNRQDVRIPPESAGKEIGEHMEVRVKQGVLILLSYRYGMIIGRRFNENGQCVIPGDKVDQWSTAEDDLIIEAVNLVEHGERADDVQQRIDGELEKLLHHYTLDQLTRPEDFEVYVPPKGPGGDELEEGWIIEAKEPADPVKFARMTPAQQAQNLDDRRLFPNHRNPIRNGNELLKYLALYAGLLINRRTAPETGTNVVNFGFLGIVPKSQVVQAARELRTQMQLLREANADSDMSDSELLAANTDQLGQVVIGKSIESGIKAAAQLFISQSSGKKKKKKKP